MINLTDIFSVQPTFAYKWYIDGEEAGMFKNINKVFKEAGKHVVRVDVKAIEVPVDCKGFEYQDSLKGSFMKEIVLKGMLIHKYSIFTFNNIF